MSKMSGFFAISAAAAMTMVAGASGARAREDVSVDGTACHDKACSCEGACACMFHVLPEAVRATIDTQTAGRRVEMVCMDGEVNDGSAVIYQARYKKDGTHWDVRIAEDGTLISKEKKA
jgi:hypothetical protein